MRRRRVSALRGGSRRFQRRELARAGIQRVCAAEGDGLVAPRVAERRPEHDRDAESGETLGDRLLASSRILTKREEVANHETLGALERPAEQELREQAVEPIRRLVQVFEEDEAALQLRLQRRAAHRREARQIPSGQRSFGATVAGGAAAPREGPRRLAEEELPESLHRAGFLAELRAHRSVDRRHALATPQLVQDGGVAVADEKLARQLAQVGGEAEQPVAAAGEDHRLGVAAEGILHLALPARVVSREVPGARKDFVAEAGLETDAAQRLDATLEALAVEPARGGDDVDRVPGTKRFHARSLP